MKQHTPQGSIQLGFANVVNAHRSGMLVAFTSRERRSQGRESISLQPQGRVGQGCLCRGEVGLFVAGGCGGLSDDRSG